MFHVRIGDFEVTSNLRFCCDSFDDKSYLKGVTQLQSILLGMCSSGKQTKKDCPRQLLQNCVQSTVDLIPIGVKILDSAKDKEKEKKEQYLQNKNIKPETDLVTTDLTVSDIVTESAKIELKKAQRKQEEILIRQTCKIQIEIHDTLVALKHNDMAASLLYGTYVLIHIFY